MNTFLIFAYVCLSLKCVLCRDFYMGMFRRNDLLVAQDNLYKERRPYSFVHAEYGRLFKCPITYFRVVDRLGVRAGGTTTVVRGGLLKKYITVRLKSCYNCPISVNIYVGCENVKTTTIPPLIVPTDANQQDDGNTTGSEASAAGAEDTTSIALSASVPTTESGGSIDNADKATEAAAEAATEAATDAPDK